MAKNDKCIGLKMKVVCERDVNTKECVDLKIVNVPTDTVVSVA
jgi:hypothetical protein